MQENRLKNYFHLHFIVFIWGFTAVLGALISIDAMPLVWFRMLLGTLFLLIYILASNKSIWLDSRTLLKFLLGGIIIALHWITFFLAIKTSNISIALVSLSTGAFFTSILEPIFFKRKLRFLELFLGIIVVVGLYIIFNVEGDYFLGIVYGLISSFLSALFSVINGLFVRKNEPVILSFFQLFFGVLFITIVLLFKGDFSVEFFQLSKNDWLYLLLLSSICTAYAFSASVKVMKVLSPYTVMLTINLEPVYGVILALMIFPEKEKMPVNFYFGALIILFAVILNGILKNRKQLINRLRKKEI
ncbi:DMT family transporter [Urechidicola croceus]|uniref:Permease n=1 Tax=Urechidicola croceus TaxID=1850246 RepID=A0A1D8P693_9FLAO|nr:DMT family transporter [Urechidicola croceus]AOW20083.1 permease [Urechidicola croceus]